MESDNSTLKFNLERIAFGAAGVLCPVPLVGEAFLSAPIYTGIRRITPGVSRRFAISASLAAAGVLRAGFYKSSYIPMIGYVFGS